MIQTARRVQSAKLFRSLLHEIACISFIGTVDLLQFVCWDWVDLQAGSVFLFRLFVLFIS